MRFDTLPEWLAWQETLHFTEVDPGLARITQVWHRLDIDKTLPFHIVTVAGTNGKGSSVAMLESIVRAAGYRTGSYTSPHLLRYNERIMVDGQACDDAAICAVFEQIDQAREGVSLTYFEFATLAALLVFYQQKVDIAILEVGMGGRLDAVNLVDADIALITPISLDHTQWLGNDREQIAYEKAGIMRPSHPVVCSERMPAHSLVDYAHEIGAPLAIAGRDFDYESQNTDWCWHNADLTLSGLVMPQLVGEYQLQNASAVLQVVAELKTNLGYRIDQQHINQGLKKAHLLGRFQVISGPVTHIFDVTHNRQGAENLALLLSSFYTAGKTYAVLGMLRDKDVSTLTDILSPYIAHWCLGGLATTRGHDAASLRAEMSAEASTQVSMHATVIDAYQQALTMASTGDQILIFGSFHTVEQVMMHQAGGLE